MRILKYLMLILCLCSLSYAADKMDVDSPPIEQIYFGLAEKYDNNLSAGEYQKAFDCAKELLSIDPSDSLAYLRLVIASQNLTVDKNKLREMYSHEIAEGTVNDKELKSLANAIISSILKSKHK